MNKKIVCYVAVAVILAACSSKNQSYTDDKTILAVSIEPQRAILEKLVDSTFSVVTLLTQGSNPESFDPSSSERMKIEHADIYFSTGVLPFEKTLERTCDTEKLTETSTGIEFIYDTHAHSHHGEEHEADPHYWSSVAGLKCIAANMTDRLASKYPTKARYFNKKLEALYNHLDSVDTRLRTIITDTPSKAFAVWHPSLSYFARDYGLKQIAVGQEGKEKSAKGLREAIDKASAHGVKVFFFQKEYDSRQAEAINDGIGSRIVTIDPLSYNWETELTTIANELAKQ